jgi:hypothetical protein
MFRIECFCDDAKLGKVLMALNGLAYDVSPTPVANAKIVAGKVRQVNGSTLEVLMTGIAKRRLKEVRARDMREIFVEAGLREEAYSHALTEAQSLGLLKKQHAANAKYTHYKVTGKKMPKGVSK